MKSEIVTGPVDNRILMEVSPMEDIAKVIDFYFPCLFANLLDIVENNSMEKLRKEYSIGKIAEEISKNNIKDYLIDVFWPIANKENVYDAMFFNDYYLYINFFLQYPALTGKPINREMKCIDIVHLYRNYYIDGTVLGTNNTGEYLLIISEENDVNEKKLIKKNLTNSSEVGDVIQEILQIDHIIAEYNYVFPGF